MNSMTIAKYGGALSGALLVFLLINWLANGIYGTGEAGHEGEEELAYVVEGADEGAAAETAEEQTVDVAALVAAADVARGEKVFAKCKACHKREPGANATGPTLFGVVGREIASVPGFGYSSAMQALEGSWTEEELFRFLQKPKDYVPGTKMSFGGLKKDSDRANLIAYLKTLK